VGTAGGGLSRYRDGKFEPFDGSGAFFARVDVLESWLAGLALVRKRRVAQN